MSASKKKSTRSGTRPSSPAPDRPPREQPVPLAVAHPHAAGIDVHSDNHWVCVGPDQVRMFGAYTVALEAIADHLKDHGVTSIVMESTGVYWIALYELLESRGFEVFLVEPGQLAHCGARPKTDRLDCQWLQRLHTYGLLRGSFRPPESILALRAYHRQRQMLIRYAAGHVQHMQKALEQMNVKLTEVLSDITGQTGLAIITHILAGERDAKVLAALRDEHCKKPEEEIARALAGVWRAEHLFELRQAYDLFQFYQKQVAACDEQLQAELAQLPARSGDKPVPHKARRHRSKNGPRFDACGPLFKALGVDLTEIEGIDVGTALVILAEIGVDVSRFPTEKHFASWLGVCPRDARSNHTQKKRSPRKGKHRVKQALRMCAQVVGRTQTPLGMFYRRIKSRIGGMGAVTATAHKLARLVYRMLKYGKEYVQQGMEDYAAKMKANVERALRRKAGALGYDLVAKVESQAAAALG